MQQSIANPYYECDGCRVDTKNWVLQTCSNDEQRTPVACPIVQHKQKGSAFIYKGQFFSLMDFARSNGLTNAEIAKISLRFHRDFRTAHLVA